MKIKNNKAIGFLTVFVTLFSLGSCSDEFLEEKKDYSGLNEQVFMEPSLAQQYIDYTYVNFMPARNAAVFTWDLASGGNSDFAKTTDELPGQTNWNREWASITYDQNMCLQYLGSRLTSSVANNSWTRVKQINLFLEEIDKHGMAEADKNPLKGQMYFWRAYAYFEMVKLYGGVPIILTSQNPIIDENSDAKVPRSSTSACIEQIISDLDMSKELLKNVTWSTAEWGRITSGAVAAYKGRVLLTWASPLFNPTDDVQRWDRAYVANTEAKALLESQGKGLFNTGGTTNGVAWGNMWFTEVGNKEAVIVFGFNKSQATTDASRNNGWENACRSKSAGGNGSISPTKQMVDAFPMIDGKKIDGNSSYNPVLFYKNRDPRFDKTFAYNGAIWKYAANTNFKQWTYSWTKAGTGIPNLFTEGSNKNSTGIYLRKATAENADNFNLFKHSGTDYMEMRFAEVVLNLAESAIGVNKLSEGKDLIKSIRIRAGIIPGDSDYGLAGVTSRDQHFAAVLNERKIELAYENKRFYDLRRWMLFDDSKGTCTRLGVTPLNGTRRTGYFIVAKNTAGSNYAGTPDPFLPNASGQAVIVNRDPTFPYVIPSTGVNPGTSYANYAAYMDYLYTNYFSIVEKDNDVEETDTWKFTWYNQYYYFGIHKTLLDTAPYLRQTQGWGGDFNPLQ